MTGQNDPFSIADIEAEFERLLGRKLNVEHDSKATRRHSEADPTEQVTFKTNEVKITLKKGNGRVMRRRALNLIPSEAASQIKTQPPASGEFLVRLLCPKDLREVILGDAEEAFRCNLARGSKRARWMYMSEVLRSLVPLACASLKRWGWIAFVVEAVRRWAAA